MTGVDDAAAPSSPYEWPSVEFAADFLSSFVALSDSVSVLAAEVAAVTNGKGDTTNVYLRGGGGAAHLNVNRPLVEVINILADARSGP